MTDRHKLVIFREEHDTGEREYRMLPDPETGRRKKTSVVTREGRGTYRVPIHETEWSLQIEMDDGSVISIAPDATGAGIELAARQGPGGVMTSIALAARPKSSNVLVVHTVPLHDEDLHKRTNR